MILIENRMTLSRKVTISTVVVIYVALGPSSVLGLTPAICDAAYKGDATTMKQLLASDPGLANAKCADGKSPLHYATLKQRTNVVEQLLASKADVNFKD